MAKLQMFLPITKVDSVKREVWGVLAEEVKDKSGEIFDYGTSKKYFQGWNDNFAKATDGKSVGNLRSMHSPIAAGKFIQMNYDDASKRVTVGAKVVDDNEWKKVEEGVYTGFSIGGKYLERWYDPDQDATRYTADPSEGSLVDNPCMYGATFKLVKGEGVEEMVKFVGSEVSGVDEKQIRYSELKAKEELTDAEKAEMSDLEKHFTALFLAKAAQADDKGDGDGDADDKGGAGDADDKGGDSDEDMEKRARGEGGKDNNLGTDDDQQKTPVGADKEEGQGKGDVSDGKGDADDATPDGADNDNDADDQLKAKSNKAAGEDNDLEKRGARNSAADGETIQAMHDHSCKLGAKCSHDNCGDGDEAGKAAEADMKKFISDAGEVAKAVNGFKDTIAKMSEGFSTLQKAFDDLKGENSNLVKRLEALEALPADGGAVTMAVDKAFGGAGKGDGGAQNNKEVLKGLIASTTDLVAKQALSTELAVLEMKDAQKNPQKFTR